MIRPAAPHILVFDLDDTLYREHDFVLSGFQAVDRRLQATGIHGFGVVAQSLFMSGQRGNVFDEALKQLSVTPEKSLIAELVETYRSHAPILTLFSDAEWALSHYGSNSRIGLLTDGFATTQRNKVKALGLENRFAATMFTDDLGREHWKPSRLPFERIATILEAPSAAERFVYVADNPRKDFVAPNELGWTTVRVRRPGGEYSALEPQQETHSPKFEIENLEQLPSVLD
jgi:putative hydrolase of the HAD superfamily